MVFMGVMQSDIQLTKYVLAGVLLAYPSTLKKAIHSSQTSGELLPDYTVLQANRLDLHSHRDNFAFLHPLWIDIRMKVLWSVMLCKLQISRGIPYPKYRIELVAASSETSASTRRL
jgi:hypothetical protein